MPGEDPLEGFKEHRKGGGQYPTPDHPAVSYQPTSKNIQLLKKAFEELGEPGHVRVFWKDTKLAVVPATPHEENAYKITEGGASFSCGWLEESLGFEPTGGWYRAEIAGDVLTVDFSDEPFRELARIDGS